MISEMRLPFSIKLNFRNTLMPRVYYYKKQFHLKFQIRIVIRSDIHDFINVTPIFNQADFSQDVFIKCALLYARISCENLGAVVYLSSIIDFRVGTRINVTKILYDFLSLFLINNQTGVTYEFACRSLQYATASYEIRDGWQKRVLFFIS